MAHFGSFWHTNIPEGALDHYLMSEGTITSLGRNFIFTCLWVEFWVTQGLIFFVSWGGGVCASSEWVKLFTNVFELLTLFFYYLSIGSKTRKRGCDRVTVECARLPRPSAGFQGGERAGDTRPQGKVWGRSLQLEPSPQNSGSRSPGSRWQQFSLDLSGNFNPWLDVLLSLFS